MAKVRILVAALFTVFFTLACSVTPVEEKPNRLDYPPELEAVHSLILQEKTADARLKIEDYINKADNIHWYGHAYFLMGFLYELDKDFENAEKYYHTAIQHGSAYESRVEAKALYNLSFVFEKTKKMDQLLVSLVDLMKRRRFFNNLTGNVEIPARLATLYAFAGKTQDALKFHREARTYFEEIVRSEKFKDKKSEISKSLYYLGLAVYDQNGESFDTLVEKLSIGQKYFLASAEASKSEWSTRSLEVLTHQYDRAWGMVQEFEPKGFSQDPMAHKKQKHMRQLVMASDLYDLMHKIRAEEFPMTNVNPRSKAIMDKTAQWIERIEQFALKLNLGPETIRTKAVANKRLSKFIEEKEEKVLVNKEKATSPENKQSSPTALPEKKNSESIGSDPNL